jgi:hypothetical protein
MVPVVRAFSARGGSTCNNLAESDAEASARRDRTLVSPFSWRADDDASASATTADCTTRATQMSSWQCDSHTTCCDHYRGSCAGSDNLPEDTNEVYLVRPCLARMGVPRWRCASTLHNKTALCGNYQPRASAATEQDSRPDISGNAKIAATRPCRTATSWA